jgi:hypothetical protein
MIETVMHILHHCNHEPALSTRIEKTYLGNVDNKTKTRSVMKVSFNLGSTSATDPLAAA